MKFRKSTIETFMGGVFTLQDAETVGALRADFKAILDKLKGWGQDDTKISSIFCSGRDIQVNLDEGVVQ